MRDASESSTKKIHEVKNSASCSDKINISIYNITKRKPARKYILTGCCPLSNSSRDRFIFLTASSFCLSSVFKSSCAAQTQINIKINSNIEIFSKINNVILVNDSIFTMLSEPNDYIAQPCYFMSIQEINLDKSKQGIYF